jgi:hypothetical protein
MNSDVLLLVSLGCRKEDFISQEHCKSGFHTRNADQTFTVTGDVSLSNPCVQYQGNTFTL